MDEGVECGLGHALVLVAICIKAMESLHHQMGSPFRHRASSSDTIYDVRAVPNLWLLSQGRREIDHKP